MSGLELAGVALGAFPVAILMMELFEKAAAATKKYKDYETGLDWVQLQIETEQVVFDNILRHLLADVVGPAEVAAMMNDPKGRAWNNTENESKLQARLGTSYALFQRHVVGMWASLDGVGKKLPLDANGKVRILSGPPKVSAS